MPAIRLTAQGLGTQIGDWRSTAPLHAALAGRIQVLLLDGRLSGEVFLPAERDLAAVLGVSRTTVTAAYRDLRHAGFARTRVGSGTVTAIPPATEAHHPDGRGALDLTKATLPATALLEEAMRATLDEVGPHLAGSGYSTYGEPALRQAIASHYDRHGLPTTPEQVIVTTGAQSALAILARTLLDRGDRVFAESPSYPNAYDALRAAGARLVTSPVTVEDGWDVDALASVFRRAAPTVGYVIPEYHNPTGRSMAPRERAGLLEAAASAGTVLVADDTTAHLDIDRGTPWSPLAADAEEAGGEVRVIHVGSAGKLLWAGLRIGWIRADEHTVQRVAAERATTDMGSPVFDQLVVARLLPRIGEVIPERRAQLGLSRAALVAAVGAHLPGWRLPPSIEGGLAAWVHLGTPASSRLALAARSHGVLVNAGPRFGTQGAFESYLRIPLTLDPAALHQAIGVFAQVWPRVGAMDRAEGQDLSIVA